MVSEHHAANPVRLKANEAPPPDYYRANFVEVLTFAEQVHGNTLSPEDRMFINRFLALPQAAQRLFVRMLMRKGPVFVAERLSYAEVGDTKPALDALVATELLQALPPVAADQLLALLPKDQLLTLGARLSKQAGVDKRMRKIELIAHLVERFPDAQLRRTLAKHTAWVALPPLDVLQRLLLVYFGRGSMDLTAFVLRDLGMMRYEDYNLEPAHSAFVSAQELAEYQRLERLGLHLALLLHPAEQNDLRSPDYAEWLAGEIIAHRPSFQQHRSIERRRNRLLNELGRWHERQQAFESALSCYAHSHRHPARERSARVLRKLGREDECAQLLGEIEAHPWSGDELVFAQRFGKQSMPSPPTQVRTLATAPEAYSPGLIEAIALGELEGEGAWGVHTENALVMTLTGLTYWQSIFAPVPGAFTNRFQSAPNDLYWEDFATVRAGQIEADAMALKEDPEQLLRLYREKNGIANALVNWRAIDEEILAQALEHIPIHTLWTLVDYVVHNLSQARRGFPDLFVVHASGRYEFVEVKGPNDQLQLAQRVWFAQFDRLGINASVLKYKE